MNDSVEREPPDNSLHRRLWQMGFGPDQRWAIIQCANAQYADPVRLGQAIATQTYKTIEEMGVGFAYLSRVDRFLSGILRCLKWIANNPPATEWWIMRKALRWLPGQVRLLLGCECHYAKPYGWVVMAGCPYHD